MNNKNNQIKSFSDQLAIKFLKNQGMNTIKNVQNFTKALDSGFMQYYLDEFDNLVSIYEPNTITRELKRKSKVCAKIYLSKAYPLSGSPAEGPSPQVCWESGAPLTLTPLPLRRWEVLDPLSPPHSSGR